MIHFFSIIENSVLIWEKAMILNFKLDHLADFWLSNSFLFSAGWYDYCNVHKSMFIFFLEISNVHKHNVDYFLNCFYVHKNDVHWFLKILWTLNFPMFTKKKPMVSFQIHEIAKFTRILLFFIYSRT